jgi:hypothetical protein
MERLYDHGPQNHLCSAGASYLEWVAERRARELSVRKRTMGARTAFYNDFHG